MPENVKTNSLKIHTMPETVYNNFFENDLINENELYLVKGSSPVVPLSEGGTGIAATSVEDVRTALGVASADHTSTEKSCGVGTGSVFGHVKLTDAIDSNSGINDGVAATPAAVKNVYDNVVKNDDVVTVATANKLLKLNANAKLPANILEGTVPITNLPHGALERCVVVANDTARFALTSEQVQLGDTVKVTDTGMMYFVVDNTKLAEDDGYEVYTAGSATNVDWSGVTNTPTTLSEYGIKDAVSVSDLENVRGSINIIKTDGVNSVVQYIKGSTSKTVEYVFSDRYPVTGEEYPIEFDIPEDEASVVVNLYSESFANVEDRQFYIVLDGVNKGPSISIAKLINSELIQTSITKLTKGTHIFKFLTVDGEDSVIPIRRIVIRGKQSNVIGSHATALGRYNTVTATGENSMAVNYNNTVEAENAFVANSANRIEAAAEGSFVAGHVNTAISPYQAIFGTYSNAESNDLFVIGNGLKDENGVKHFQNAFKVDNKGKTVVSGELIAGPYYSFNKDADAFVVGNGFVRDDGTITYQNALKVEKKGNTTINGKTTINGNVTVVGSISASKPSTFSSSTRLGNAELGSETSYGEYSHVSGGGSVAFNRNNTVDGVHCFAALSSNVIPAGLESVFVAGHANTAVASHQAIFGTYSRPDANDLFVVGNGSKDKDGVKQFQNAFKVDRKGNFTVQTSLSIGDTKLDENKLKELIAEPKVLTTSLNPNTWVDNTYTITHSYITADCNGSLTIPNTITDEEYEALLNAGIRISDQTTGSLTLKCLETPEIEIPVTLTILP